MIKTVKGTKDILPPDVSVWQQIERDARDLFHRYGYQEIRLPIFERTELFARSIGAETDIVGKEMYTFPDRDGTSLTLRPEGTAGVVRSYIEHSLFQRSKTWKLFYLGPMFRHERPQAGRLRQFHQVGVEALGYTEPYIDIEVIVLLHRFLTGLRVPAPRLEVNSIGDQACRPSYLEDLARFLTQVESRLCENCRRRTASNPLRVLDCKVEHCRDATREAPNIIEALCKDCRAHFDFVLEGLNTLDVQYTVNPRLVRGLDYYTRTTFEMVSARLGAQDAVAAGGRYDGLVEALSGPKTPGIGFAIGLERLVSLVAEHCASRDQIDVFIAALGENAQRAMFPFLDRIRTQGLVAEMEYSGGSLKSQMRQADRLGARLAVIVGDDETEKHCAVVRDMTTKAQEVVTLSELEHALVQRCRDRGAGATA